MADFIAIALTPFIGYFLYWMVKEGANVKDENIKDHYKGL